MATAHTASLPKDENTTLGPLQGKVVTFGTIIGLVGFAVALVFGVAYGDGMSRFFHSYLIAFCYCLSISFGALFFTVLQHLVRARWSVVVRRLAEIISCTMPLMLVLSLVIIVPVLFGYHGLYEWLDSHLVHSDTPEGHLLHGKAAWLNGPFFALRILVYLGVASFIANYFRKKSVEQDETGDVAITDTLRRASAPGVIAFAFICCLASFDLLMSVSPTWFSTIFGVYYFAGCAMSIMAVLALVSMWLQRSGRLQTAITVEHYHDLGKLLFAFLFFWSYIAFSQFMLIWYANIPEETFWYQVRMQEPWANVSLLLLFGHCLVPFVFLLSRNTKRNLPVLAFFCVWMLFMHAVDFLWLIVPAYHGEGTVNVMDIALLVGMLGLFIAYAAKQAGADKHLIPIKDPRLSASLRFENF